jgi:transcriptional regulator with XRE-family HTH domain
MARITYSEQRTPAKVAAVARQLGRNISIARKRRRLRQQDLAQRAGITIQTLRRVERGSLGTGLGAYVAALWAMGLDGPLAFVADPPGDLEGSTLEAAARGERVRPQEGLSSDF